MRRLFALAAVTALATGPVRAEAPAGPPRLVVAIAVDQLSADLFAQYRSRFTGGLARLAQGVVFPSAYQSHAATETCPGHSTILTGVRPSRSGIIANNWYDPRIDRADKRIYCAEDSRDPASSSNKPVVSARHLGAATLGDRLKSASPAAINVAVSGKDRSAVMMGGKTIDQAWWWQGGKFSSFTGAAPSPAVDAVNTAVRAQIAKGAKPIVPPAWCAARDRSVQMEGFVMGQGRFALKPGEDNAFRVSPRFDAATADLALRLVDSEGMGKDAVADVLSVGLSATDYIGHALGSEGLEMCIQMAELDRTIGTLLAGLDKRKLDYVMVLTADHGGFDAPERLDRQAYPTAARLDRDLTLASLAAEVTRLTGIKAASGPLLIGDGPIGDIYFSASLSPADRTRGVNALAVLLRNHSQVAAVFTATELAQTPLPAGSPQDWTLRERARASFDPSRSGDVLSMAARGIVPIPKAGPGYVATHGSPWDYDRRVPLLFWRRGMAGFEQPAPVETVDIAPTLTAILNLPVPEGDFDGRCLDLDASDSNTCGTAP